MSNIGIVGGGVAGLHLGLLLQRHDTPVTIYTDRSPDQLRSSRLPNAAARLGALRARERVLGVDHWQDCGNLYGMNIYVGGQPPLTFSADLDQPGSFVDMRIYLATLLEDFAARGGEVVLGALQAEDVARLSARHDLMVVASGRGSLIEMFPRIAKHSPYTTPQRVLTAGLYRGIANPEPARLDYTIAPGLGEIFTAAYASFESQVSVINIESIPGQAWDQRLRRRYEDDPAGFNQTVLDMLRRDAPETYARIDTAAFGLTRPLDLLQGAITPTVRRAYADLGNGKFAVAIGDVHMVNDPLLGQGANQAGYSAWTLGEAILEDVAFDEWFCRRVEQRIWARAEAVVDWNNFMLQPPAPHVIEFMVAAAQHPSIANAYARNFDHPQRNWNILATPERTAAFLRQAGVTPAPAAELTAA